MENWNTTKSAELYRVADWGDGYFGINAAGNLTVNPSRNGAHIDLYELVCSLVQRDIRPPVLLRFDGILRDRVKRLYQAFNSAIEEQKYSGRYMGVYPIKVNQQRHVVDALRLAGRQSCLGLEVGSKPELIAVLAIHDTPGALLLCNGYKDDEYLELALLGRRIGRRVIVIVEQLYELNQILEISRRLGIEAEIGIRMRPATKGSGHWEQSGGDHAKFGLSTPEIVSVLEILAREGKQEWLKLLHFHIGSQITSIAALKRALREASRLYTDLARSCPGMCFLDVGGGLAVDYDGSRTNSDSSMNYTLEEYARDTVEAIAEACSLAEVPPPDIVTESGRALTAHHSVLITEVIAGTSSLTRAPGISPPPTDAEILGKIYEMFSEVSVKNCHETLNDALAVKDEVLELFNQGELSLLERSYADQMLWQLIARIKALSGNLRYVPEDLEKLSDYLRDVYFCNFSVFQSVLDSWAVNQLFPIMPIHRLQQEPVCEVSLADMCCDSEGSIDRFIDLKDIKRYLRLHNFSPSAPYYIGIFLVGAYQEVLGDLYNLYGDTNAVHVNLISDETGRERIELAHVVEGDTARETLSYVQYSHEDLIERLRVLIEKNLQQGLLRNDQAAQLQKRFREALEGYTYLSTGSSAA